MDIIVSEVRVMFPLSRGQHHGVLGRTSGAGPEIEAYLWEMESRTHWLGILASFSVRVGGEKALSLLPSEAMGMYTTGFAVPV